MKNKNKKLLVIQFYREFKQTGKKTDLDNKSPANQSNRLLNFLSYWEKAVQDFDDVICIGDMNLDHKRLSNSSHPLKPLSELVTDRISRLNIRQMVSTETWTNGRVTRCIDHIYTTNSKEMESVNSVQATNSDHCMISAVFNLKAITVRKQQIEIRNMSKYSPENF